jgi:hypothetical protein
MASQNRDRTKRRRPLRPRLCSAPLALRCVRGTPVFTTEKSRLAAGLSLLSHNYASGLAILLALLALAALTAGILLLLAGLCAAALLLAGFLTRVLILLARILVWIGHSGSPILRCSECNGKTTAKAQLWFPKKLRFPRDHCVAQICPECGFGTEKLPVYSRLSRTPRCCRPRFPLLENDLRRGVPAAGAIAASL